MENLIALGVDARLETVDQAQFEERTVNPKYDFDLITDNARSAYFSGSELKQYYGSETADVSAFNVYGLKSPAVDKLIEVVIASRTKDELTVATKALDRVLRAEGSGSRSGTRPATGSPTTTCTNIPTRCPHMLWAKPRCGGTTPKKPKP